jgi:hypothetical protein
VRRPVGNHLQKQAGIKGGCNECKDQRSNGRRLWMRGSTQGMVKQFTKRIKQKSKMFTEVEFKGMGSVYSD